jgi:hypothetical protein
MRPLVLAATAILAFGLVGCGGGGDMSGPMRVESRTPNAPPTQDQINREMIDAARKRERMSARGI